MENYIRNNLLARSRWHFTRVLYLLSGSFFAGSYFLGYPYPAHLALGLLLLFMAAADLSCPFGTSCRMRR